MKQICAWCGKELNPNVSPDSKDVCISYGICLPCANTVISDVPMELSAFLDQISVPVVLMDFDGVVKTANQKACSMLGKVLPEIDGFLGGDVFECAYAKLPGGCGKTYHCSGCAILRSVMETYDTGRPISRRPATLKQGTSAAPQEVTFIISTEKFSNYVLLKIYTRDAAAAQQRMDAPKPAI